MIKFQLLKKNLAAFQCFTGLNLAAFYELLPSFEQAYEADLDQRDKERARKRQRERGGGRNGALTGLENKLLFILFRKCRAMFSAWAKHKLENGSIG